MSENARVRAFVAGLEPSARDAIAEADVAPALARAVATARGAWPGIELVEDTFLAFVAERVTEATAGGIDRLPASDLYLACACSRGDPAALRAFEEHVMPAVDPALAHAKIAAQLVDEVKQRIRIKLFTASPDHAPRILDYMGRGNLRAWLRVIAVREGLNVVRGDRRAHASDISDVPLVTDDLELEHLKARYRTEFRRAIALAATSLAARERNLLRQYYLDGFTLDAMSRMYRVHLATIARWVDKARTQLLAETRRVLVTQMNIPRDELDSILRLVESQLEVSARDFLADLDT